MISCTVEETVGSSTFLVTDRSLSYLVQSLDVPSADPDWYCYVSDRGGRRLLSVTVPERGAGLFTLLSGKASHLMMTSAEYKLLLRSNTLTLATPLSKREPTGQVWANSGTLTKLQSTLSKLADEA